MPERLLLMACRNGHPPFHSLPGDFFMNVTIIGAGPAGLLLAHQLLSAGSHYRIRIHERLDDPRAGGQCG